MREPFVNGNPTLEQTPLGAGVALRAAGEWTVHHAPALEKIIEWHVAWRKGADMHAFTVSQLVDYTESVPAD